MTDGAQVGIRRSGAARGGVGLGVVLSVAVIAFALLWSAAESHYKSCIAAATAKFPAVPVSANNGAATGPLKLSFTSERQKAVKDCHRY